MGDGGVEVHRFKGGLALLLRRTRRESSHVVEAVGKLDDYYPDILRHSHEYLPDILRLLLLLGNQRDKSYLCNAVDHQRNIFSELLAELVKGDVGVLHGVVEQRRTDGIGIHAVIQQDRRHSQRVRYIRVA